MPLTIAKPTAKQKSSFDRIALEASECRLCARMCERTAVLSNANGVLNAKVFFVGEAPGQKGADRTRIPFSGDISGRNFDKFIASIGLRRASCFLRRANRAGIRLSGSFSRMLR